MAGDQGLKNVEQNPSVELLRRERGKGHVVGGTLRRKLVQEP